MEEEAVDDELDRLSCIKSCMQLKSITSWVLFSVSFNVYLEGEDIDHRLNMELDFQSLFGSCVQLYSLAETPQLPPSPRIWAHIRGRCWSAR